VRLQTRRRRISNASRARRDPRSMTAQMFAYKIDRWNAPPSRAFQCGKSGFRLRDTGGTLVSFADARALACRWVMEVNDAARVCDLFGHDLCARWLRPIGKRARRHDGHSHATGEPDARARR